MKRLSRLFHNIEKNIAIFFYLTLIILPILQIFLRLFGGGILGLDNYLVHSLLIIGFIGGMLATQENRHLAIGSAEVLSQKSKYVADIIWRCIAVVILTALTVGSLYFLIVGFAIDQRVGVVPLQVLVAVIPIAYIVITKRIIAHLPRKHKVLLTTISAVIGVWFSIGSAYYLFSFLFPTQPLFFLESIYNAQIAFFSIAKIPLIIIFIAAAFIGFPLFLALAGIALTLFSAAGIEVSILPNEGYNMLTNPTIPAIPLFTLAGYILSESKASERLIRVFKQLFGWMPGGLVITTVAASAFFTAFTGASGVTILALGGLLLPILLKEGRYSERFSTGLLTSSSNIGLLFPPSLAIILYGTIAQINIYHVFLGGLLPGALMVTVFCIAGIILTTRERKKKPISYTFNAKDAVYALKDAAFELLVPVVVIVSIVSGIATLIESAAIAVLYVLIVEVLIKRELTIPQVGKVITKCLVIIGGILLILASARGLSYYIIDAQIPTLLSDWVSTHISSRFVFLILLNLALLITGCFMDIFSAILIVAPLVIPLGNLFDIHPVHLGIIFLANLGVGFITPPVGIDLFLASYRFGKPLTKLYRNIIPFFIIEFLMVLLITYVPFISTFLLRFAQSAGGY